MAFPLWVLWWYGARVGWADCDDLTYRVRVEFPEVVLHQLKVAIDQLDPGVPLRG